MKTDVAAATFTQKSTQTTCRSCGHVGLKPVLDLGITALVDTLVTREQLGARENKHPLQVGFCPTCALMQVCDTVPPEEVFHAEYTYYASFSTTWLEHSKRCVLKQIERLKEAEADLRKIEMLVEKEAPSHKAPVSAVAAAPAAVLAR